VLESMASVEENLRIVDHMFGALKPAEIDAVAQANVNCTQLFCPMPPDWKNPLCLMAVGLMRLVGCFQHPDEPSHVCAPTIQSPGFSAALRRLMKLRTNQAVNRANKPAEECHASTRFLCSESDVRQAV